METQPKQVATQETKQEPNQVEDLMETSRIPAAERGTSPQLSTPLPQLPTLAGGPASRAIADDAHGPALTPLIERATLADAEAILALQHKAYQAEARLYNDWLIPPLVQTLEEWREEFETSIVLKAIIDGRLIGSVRANETAGLAHIGRLIVTPELQGRGIGTALLRAIEACYPPTTSFELFTGSLSVDNIRLYRRHGYSVVREEVLGPTVVVVFMQKLRDRIAR